MTIGCTGYSEPPSAAEGASSFVIPMASWRRRPLSVLNHVRDWNDGPKQKPSSCHCLYHRLAGQLSKCSVLPIVTLSSLICVTGCIMRMLPVQCFIVLPAAHEEIEKSHQSAELLA